MSIKNGVVTLGNDQMDYVRFGRGQQTLILLPGLGEGLRTVKGTALPMALLYRAFGRRYTVYMFSRKRVLSTADTTENMARHLKKAMDALSIDRAAVVGVSMGGMIAMHLAADYPEKVEKLVLVVTAARSNPLLTETVEEWMKLAEQNDHTAFMASNVKRIYSTGYCRKNRWMIPLAGCLTKPKSYERFLIQARACLSHDAFDKLSRITAPTLVIGGEQDLALGSEPSRELAGEISGAKLLMYSQWGHGLYEEAGDFQQQVLAFLQET